MQKSIPVLIIVIICCFMFRVSAQRTRRVSTKADSTKVRQAPTVDVPVYLGTSGLSGGPIRKGQFDTFAKQGLILNGVQAGGAVKSFNFVYAERVMYEDSIGNPLLLTDYLTEVCEGPNLTPGIMSSIFQRTKPGDTAYFDAIRVRLPSGTSAKGKSMKFVITR